MGESGTLCSRRICLSHYLMWINCKDFGDILCCKIEKGLIAIFKKNNKFEKNIKSVTPCKYFVCQAPATLSVFAEYIYACQLHIRIKFQTCQLLNFFPHEFLIGFMCTQNFASEQQIFIIQYFFIWRSENFSRELSRLQKKLFIRHAFIFTKCLFLMEFLKIIFLNIVSVLTRVSPVTG